jgi:hypothetical protein
MSTDCRPPESSPGAEPWLDGDQGAQYTRISKRSLERFRLIGGGPRYAKAGRRVLYRREWLDEWLESRSFTSTAEAKRSGIR